MKDKPELQSLTELLGIKIVVGGTSDPAEISYHRQYLNLTILSLDHKLACQYTQIDASNPEKVYSVVIEWAEGERFRSE